MKRHFLWFDTETGGLNAESHSLLTAYFAVCDQDLKLIDELYLQLKPEDVSKLNVDAIALKINKINIEEHLADPQTITYSEGHGKLLSFLEKNKIKGKRKSFMPCGHNITFDHGFVWEQLMSKDVWDKNVHHNPLDTLSVCTFLKDTGVFPEDVGTLTSLVEYLNLPMGEAHNARDDVLMNIEVYRGIRDLMQARKKEIAGSSSNSLLQIIEG